MQFTPSGGRVALDDGTHASRSRPPDAPPKTSRTSTARIGSFAARHKTDPRLSEYPPEQAKEPGFWERDPTAELQAIEKTQRELGVFRRVLIKAKPGFVSLQSSDKSIYQSFDVQHVREKFPHVSPYMAIRLGRAITRRRHYLEYTKQKSGRLLAPQLAMHFNAERHER
jgi:hypothetical protein